MIDQEYYDSNLEVWKKNFPRILKKIQQDNLVVLDIGGACGEMLFALSSLGMKQGILVEPNWKKHIKHLKVNKKDLLSKNNIKVLEISGSSPKVPYDKADLIIKTFCPFVEWRDIVGKTSAKWFLTDDSWLKPQDFPELEVVSRYTIQCNSYILLKRKGSF